VIKFLSFVCLLVLTVGCAPGISSENLYPESRMDNLPELASGKLALDDLCVGEIAIGESTFDDVAAKLGKTEFFTSGREHAARRACYRSSDSDDDTVLLLESGPMGGWKRLTTISITNSKILQKSSRCKSSPLVSRNIATASGLQIGLSVTDLVKLLGQPSVSSNRFVGYYLKTQEEDWTVISVIEAALENERVVSITVHQIYTN